MGSDEKECPLCLEVLEADDRAFYPCDCRYQVCRFCWAKIINEENGLCPACRKVYNSEKPALYKPLSESEDTKLKFNRKRKEHIKKNKLSPEMLKLLPELRVVQPNLIFVVGLPPWICKDKEILKGPEYFGRYGKVFKVEINQNQTFGGPQGQPSFSAYITFCRSEDAMRSIRELDQGMLHGRPLRVSLGTTKYCSQFLRGSKCTKHECMYLHELGDPAASFTKEEMQSGKHTEYMNKLLLDCASSLQSFASTSVANHDPSCDSIGSTVCLPLMPKDSSHSGGLGRTRNRVNSSNCSSSPFKTGGHNRSHSKRLNDSDAPSNADGRRIRQQHRNDCVYSDVSPTRIQDRSKGDCVWNRQSTNINEYPSDDTKTSGRPTAGDFVFPYMNGLYGPEQEKSSDRLHYTRSNDSRRGHVHIERTRCCREPFSNNSFSTASVTDSNCVTDNTSNSWHSTLPSCGSTGNLVDLHDEPVDIDFDPFRESQQGLAELLAAEINKLGVCEESIRTTGGAKANCSHRISSELVTSCSRDLGSPGGTDGRIIDYNSKSVKHTDFQWDPKCYSEEDGQNGFDVKDVASRAYPPPGFEEGAVLLPPSLDPSVFSNSDQNAADFNLSGSPYSLISPLSMDYNNSNLINPTNGPLHDGVTAFSVPHTPPDLDAKFDHSHPQIKCPKGNPDSLLSPGPGAMYHGNFVSTSPITNASYHPDPTRPDSQQTIANLFAAAFNTASAMLNSSDDKSSLTASKLSPFDLSAFFHQLCRQSPLFSSLSASLLADWNCVNGSTSRLSSLGNHQESFADTPSALSAAASVLFPSLRFQSRPTESRPECHQQDGVAFPGCSLPTGHPKQEPFSVSSSEKGSYYVPVECSYKSPTDASTSDSSVTWHLDDPAMVPSQMIPNLWQSGCSVPQPLFDALAPASCAFPSQSGSSVSNGNSTSHRQTTLHEPSLQTTTQLSE